MLHSQAGEKCNDSCGDSFCLPPVPRKRQHLSSRCVECQQPLVRSNCHDNCDMLNHVVGLLIMSDTVVVGSASDLITMIASSLITFINSKMKRYSDVQNAVKR